MEMLTVANGSNPGPDDPDRDFGKGRLDQQVDDINIRVGLDNEALLEPDVDLFDQVVRLPPAIDSVNVLQELLLAVRPVQLAGLELPPCPSDCLDPSIDGFRVPALTSDVDSLRRSMAEECRYRAFPGELPGRAAQYPLASARVPIGPGYDESGVRALGEVDDRSSCAIAAGAKHLDRRDNPMRGEIVLRISE